MGTLISHDMGFSNMSYFFRYVVNKAGIAKECAERNRIGRVAVSYPSLGEAIMKIQKKNKYVVWGIGVIFLLSLIPIIYLVGYVHATGDDYHYGAMAHWAWVDTHSVWKTLQASAKNTREFWHGWQGTWFTIFLMGLQPEVFSAQAYWIVPIVMIAANIISTSVLTHYCMIKKIGTDRITWMAVNLTVLFAFLQFLPSTKSGIFWWNGAVHYIIPYCLAVLAITFFMKFIDSYKKRYWLGAFLCMVFLGGSSYLSALLAPVILVALLIIYGKKRPRSFWLLFPLAAEAMGLIISMLSPGNAIRGGEDFGFSVGRAAGTIVQSFAQGTLTLAVYGKEKPIVWILLLLLTVFVWDAFEKREKPSFDFRLPGFFVGFMYCVWCAMFAPGIYAGVEVSGGVPNTIFQIFLLTAAANIVYVTGWLRCRQEKRGMQGRWMSYRKAVFIGVILFGLTVAGITRGTLKQTTFYNCLSFISSGRAADYKKQMEERQAVLLDDSQKVIELPEMNSEQGPFMHMEIMEDPSAWTNTVMCEFYRKDRVVRTGR